MLVSVLRALLPRHRENPAGSRGKKWSLRRHKPDMRDMKAARLASGATPSDDHDQVRAWRFQRLLDAGFDYPQAEYLAGLPGVDLHELLSLIDRGCPAHLAARILDPFVDSAPDE